MTNESETTNYLYYCRCASPNFKVTFIILGKILCRTRDNVKIVVRMVIGVIVVVLFLVAGTKLSDRLPSRFYSKSVSFTFAKFLLLIHVGATSRKDIH
ncbi:uncharacterized protein V1516DRAFT_678136 [Lipomyces oligophaga]|uniref:uncharacterized protein n=1 Tax=Lipomyces oligophaga TaxID=45792 RepID=UPI0034CD07F2